MGEFDHVSAMRLHARPNGTGTCSYLARDFCNKCGWVSPDRLRPREWRPSVVAAFALGSMMGAAVGVALTLLMLAPHL